MTSNFTSPKSPEAASTPLRIYNNKVFIFNPELVGQPATFDIATLTQDRTNLAQLGTLLNNVATLGFTFKPELMVQLKALSQPRLAIFYQALIPALQKLVGADKVYQPMYPNFPKQVMEASDAELYLNAILHYWFGLLPDYDKEPRLALRLPADLRVLELGSEAEYIQLCQNLMAAKAALTSGEKEELSWFFQTYRDRAALQLPAQIPFKETLAFVATALLKYTTFSSDTLLPYVKSATDVLRIAVAMSEGDLSLAQPTKFRQFNRPERRLLLSLLEAQPEQEATEHVLRYAERWKRLAERLHPGELKNRFPKAYTELTLVREGSPNPNPGFNSLVEQSLRDKHWSEASQRLQTKPGYFARRLDHLLRQSAADAAQDVTKPDEGVAGKPTQILEDFKQVAPKISTPVLLQVLTHFKHRSDPAAASRLRVFFPKGMVAKAYGTANTLPALGAELAEQVVNICRETLIARFSQLVPLGRVYVDNGLSEYMVPLAERASNKSLRTLARGTRIAFPSQEATTIRFFLWWKEGQSSPNGENEEGAATGRVDLDLSAVLYDSEWVYKEHISYTNLRSKTYKAAHSGDITSAPQGACEFIDLDIASVIQAGGRYVVMSVNSFTGQSFNSLPQCFAGWMMRESPQSGEIFEPATVQDKVDLSADTTIGLPLILDLVERKVVWTDIALRRNPGWVNNVEGNYNTMTLMGRAMTTMVKPDLYELFSLHAQARGTLVGEATQADTIFAPHAGTVTPFDQAVIKAEYL